ncbi:MAG: glucose-6-phosphate dehydrogenase, partial [Rickettsiales bacterium]|nr:glucose-6-phosphate dehydrogenase [Rickettsiales bacterium]
DIVIFGGNGDLSLRKILPALFHRLSEGQLPETSMVFVVDVSPISKDELVSKLYDYCITDQETPLDKDQWNAFIGQLHYLNIDLNDAPQYQILSDHLESSTCSTRIFYMATSSGLFTTIAAHLDHNHLITDTTRIVMEKPLGEDFDSFNEINQTVLRHFSEEQIYRIDHYLGKETVQNLMIIRFANAVFEKIWNGHSIEHVQITVSESIGVEKRAGYYDKYGAMKDMVQNHLLQLLCLTAMEPPSHIDPDFIRDEKVKVLKSLRPITPETISENIVLGQYEQGSVNGDMLNSYQDDIGSTSETATFAALRLFIDNWRWSGVPFYLRTGKRLKERYSEIVLQFRQVPHHLFPTLDEEPETNKLVIRIQPDESINLQMITKVPGPGGYRLKPVNLNLSLSDEFEERFPDAYERLLMDVVRGNPTLFMRSDEVAMAWHWIDSVLAACNQADIPTLPYKAGRNGPKQADDVIQQDNFKWHQHL